MFSIKLTSSSATSYIEFGAPVGGIDSFVLAKMSPGTLWSVRMSQENVGSGLAAVGMIFDSGSSYMNMPNGDMTVLNNFLL